MNLIPTSIGYSTWNLAWNCPVNKKSCSVYDDFNQNNPSKFDASFSMVAFEAMIRLTERSSDEVKRKGIRTSSAPLFA